MPTKILAIDDSKTMRLAIKITFAAEDADVTSVGKGSDAVARAKQLGADVVLVDHSLGDGEPSGYDVCQTLKNDGDTAAIPVILLVSNQGGIDQNKFKACGGDAWIAKPFDTTELLDKVADVLGKPVAKPAAAAKPAPAVTATPVVPAKPAAPVAKPAAAAAKPKAAKPKVAAAPNRPVVKPLATPARKPAAAAAAPKPTAAPGHANIPIAIPIPFTSADAPTPGMLKRLQDAGGGSGGAGGAALADLDPKVAEALLGLSRDVIEQVVWEVVPDLAEEIIKREAAARAG